MIEVVPVWRHNSDVVMSAMASQITSLTIVCSTVYSGADQRKHQTTASVAFVRGIHRGPVNAQACLNISAGDKGRYRPVFISIYGHNDMPTHKEFILQRAWGFW